MALSEANLQAQATWNNRACGTLSSVENAEAGTLETFNRLARRRYTRDDPWVPLVLDFPSMKDKEVLEIGHGQGCDLLHAAMAGAHVHGIDLTPNHHEICKRYFAALNLPVDLRLGNAGELPFASESMDIVYSLGVLHHTDNAEQCVAEAHRVLKPGGKIIIALYRFWSLPHLWLIGDGILRGRLFKLGYRNLLSTIEGGADGINIRPLVNLYTKASTEELLTGFREIRTSIHGLAYDRIPLVGRFIPLFLGKALERRWGWYVVAVATK